jgi:hypothetical protein
MGMFSSLFGKNAEEENMRSLGMSLADTTREIVKEVQRSVYNNQGVLIIQTHVEVFSALLHYVNIASLHVAGKTFQNAIYGKVRDKLINWWVLFVTKIMVVSPMGAKVELEEFCKKRELEYSIHRGEYGDNSVKNGSLVWEIAKNIHNATGIHVDDNDEAIVAIGDVFVKSLASLSLDKQLQQLSENMK